MAGRRIMKKKNIIILFMLLITFSLTACKGKVERIEPKEESQEETINGYTKEELEKSTLPEDVFDEEDANGDTKENVQSTESTETTEKDIEDIVEDYQGESGPIILPDDVFE